MTWFLLPHYRTLTLMLVTLKTSWIVVARETEPDRARTHDYARRTGLALHLRPDGTVLETLDAVHVTHGLRERLTERGREIGALALAAEAEETPAVANGDEDGIALYLALAGLLLDETDDRGAVELLELGGGDVEKLDGLHGIGGALDLVDDNSLVALALLDLARDLDN